MMLSPIDPVDAYLGPQMAQVSPEQRVLIAEQWGFDAPPAAQFNHWLRQLLSGELGWSHIYNQPVSDVINQRLAALADTWRSTRHHRRKQRGLLA